MSAPDDSSRAKIRPWIDGQLPPAEADRIETFVGDNADAAREANNTRLIGGWVAELAASIPDIAVPDVSKAGSTLPALGRTAPRPITPYTSTAPDTSPARAASIHAQPFAQHANKKELTLMQSIATIAACAIIAVGASVAAVNIMQPAAPGTAGGAPVAASDAEVRADIAALSDRTEKLVTEITLLRAARPLSGDAGIADLNARIDAIERELAALRQSRSTGTPNVGNPGGDGLKPIPVPTQPSGEMPDWFRVWSEQVHTERVEREQAEAEEKARQIRVAQVENYRIRRQVLVDYVPQYVEKLQVDLGLTATQTATVRSAIENLIEARYRGYIANTESGDWTEWSKQQSESYSAYQTAVQAVMDEELYKKFDKTNRGGGEFQIWKLAQDAGDQRVEDMDKGGTHNSMRPGGR
jgi:hypothetical protein